MWGDRLRGKLGSLSGITAGHGDQMILLHGVGLRAEAWGAQILALAAHFETFAPDMPGHGPEPGADIPNDLAGYTDRVASIISSPAHVVGHSMGALIGLDLAIRYPASVRSLTLVSPVYLRGAEAQAAVSARAEALDPATPPDPTQTLTRWFGDHPSDARDACARWLRHGDPNGYKAAYTVFAGAHDPTPRDLAEIVVPVLAVTGVRDPNSTPEMSQQLAYASGGRAEIVPDAAHMLPMTHPDTLNTLILDHVKRS